MNEEIMNLSSDEFHELAKSQSKKFPGLLKLLTEEEIISEFYSYYKRKITNEVL
jgi:hypothetical protein